MPDNHDKTSSAAPAHFAGHHYYAELLRVVSVLFVGVLALMTFLLTVGYQRPHADFSWALYSSIIILGLNLVAYVVGHMFYVQCVNQRADGEVAASVVADDKDKDNDKDKDAKVSKASKSKFEAARKRLKVTRIIQQVLFIAAVVAITWLALATAHFFFTIPTTPATTGAGQ